MKSFLLCGAAALLLVATGASAQPDQQQNDKHTAQDQHKTTGANAADHGSKSGPAMDHGTMAGHATMAGPSKDHGTMTGPAKDHGTMAGHGTMTGPAHGTMTGPAKDHGTMAGHGTMTGPNHGTMSGHGTMTGPASGHSAMMGHRGNFDMKFRVSINATHRFHAGDYRAPTGYTYRRYSVGQRIAPAYYGRDYWLNNYTAYDLMAPPDGYVWVRFGPDALLIDEDTGDVMRVVYGVFY